MNLEHYTERMRGFIQNAQNLVLASDHQQLKPEHVLKVLIDDKDCLLYTSPSPRDQRGSRMPSSA